MHPEWLVPDWPVPANVHAVCTTRAGGDSLPPYDSLNLGDHVGDQPAAVARNRQRLRDALGTRPVFLQQVHGSETARLDSGTADGTQADGCVATTTGQACTIMVADCLPVLFADMQGRAVAAAHAGWRGLAGNGKNGILEAVSEAVRAEARVRWTFPAIELVAWLGPCIGAGAFEVGAEVKAAFELHEPAAAAMFKPHTPGKWLADLQGLARQRLAALGITAVYGNDGSDAWCTVSNPSRFFSHRRDRVSRRLAACVWLG
ncbi:MAG: peptidoglycan editing factor PgeF [Ramlibacter sp.]